MLAVSLSAQISLANDKRGGVSWLYRAALSGRKEIKVVLPMWLAKATAPLSEIYYKVLRQPPLYTRYSLCTLTSESLFSNEKAKKELAYQNRDMDETLPDTV